MHTELHDISIAVALILLMELSVVFTAIYVKATRRAEYLVFAGLCGLFSILLVCARMMQVAVDVGTGVLWYRVQLACGALTSVMAVHFAALITWPAFTTMRSWRHLAQALYASGALLSAAAWSSLVVTMPHGHIRLFDLDEFARGTLYVPYVFVLLALTAIACGITWYGWVVGVNRSPRPQWPASGVDGRNVWQVAASPVNAARHDLSFRAHLGWVAASLAAVLAACIIEFLWSLGIGAEDADHLNPRAVAVCLFVAAAASMLVRELIETINERHRLAAEKGRIEGIAEARLNAVRDTQHEVKNSLIALRHRVQRAVDLLPPTGCAEARRRLEVGVTEFDDVDAMLAIFLDTSRIERGDPPNLGRQAPVDLLRAVSAACDRTTGTGRQLAAGEPPDVARREDFQVYNDLTANRYYAFPTILDRILINLLNNACKYSPRGTPVEICLKETVAPDSGSGSIHISITDHGSGVEAQDLDAIFDRPFFRTHAARNVCGNGAGLNLCRRYAQAQGGSLWAESAGTNAGTTMHLLLPRETVVPGDPDDMPGGA